MKTYQKILYLALVAAVIVFVFALFQKRAVAPESDLDLGKKVDVKKTDENKATTTPVVEQKPVQKVPPIISGTLDAKGATTDGINKTIAGNSLFAFNLYGKISEKEKGNIFISPWSISSAVSILYEGAKGKTAEEIKNTFHFDSDAVAMRSSFASLMNKINAKGAPYALNTANAFWVQKDFKILNDYISNVAKYYGGLASNLDFVGDTEGSRQIINDWVAKGTNNKIKDLFAKGTLNRNNRLVITNTVYFKGTWLSPFKKTNTKEDSFLADSKNSTAVQMMNDYAGHYNYSETDNAQILELPYKGDTLSMFVLLPKEGKMSALESELSSDNMKKWFSAMAYKTVNVSIPKFTFSRSYGLNDYLKDMGVVSAFDSASADLSGIDGGKDLSVSYVIHKTFVEVNEEGTEAAGATGISVGVTGIRLPEDIITFKADHPFIFLINDKQNGNILFMGKVVDPTK
ncbi:MAG: serpin family protein [Candidatus Taylorbacteria bacterium]|nr:serpin family protein [Candidatus Taylorbacteria bacterium]